MLLTKAARMKESGDTPTVAAAHYVVWMVIERDKSTTKPEKCTGPATPRCYCSSLRLV